MSGKYKYLYLYLALACLLGIILIFVFDGYMGIYDTLTVKSGEMPLVITADQWQVRGDSGYLPSTSAIYGENVTFSYQLDNHRFSSYQTDISISLWRNQTRLADLLATTVTAKAFGKGQVDCSFDTTQFASMVLTSGTSADFTLVIQRGDIQRKIIIYVYKDIIQMKNPQ
jgi:hypothetical protein